FDEDFLSDEALGFYEFWRGGVNARIEQQNTFSAEVFFYIEKDEFHDSIRNDTILNLRTSLSYEILQWLSLAVDYIFFQRNSSETGRSYTDNRLFLRVTAAYDVVEHLQ
ncbi:MAG: outer membrane beta-barrel protein, partial [Proteobacteria bacterium]|nr:outer membrane beta-barrel protein [Pseudomonadota bacterium]